MLRRNLPPSRKKQIKRVLMARRWKATGPTPDVVEVLRERSGGVCEMALHGCLGRATEVCHRIKRGMGGRKGVAREENNRLSNVLDGCHVCHAWTHARPTEAGELGLILKEGQDPPTEPVARRGVLVLLADDGTWEEAA